MPSADDASKNDYFGTFVDLKQELVFALGTGGWKVSSSLHPRLNAGKSADPLVTTITLDPSFLTVTKRVIRYNSAYRVLRAEIDGSNDMNGSTVVLEDPRPHTVSPATYLLASPTHELKLSGPIHVFVFFQNETTEEPRSDGCSFLNPLRTLLLPLVPSDPSVPKDLKEIDKRRLGQGNFDPTVDGYDEYPFCGWQDQLELSGAPVLLVFPTITDKKMAFGDFGDPGPSVGIPRLERMLAMLWADSKKTGPPPVLGKLMIGGWSSGMNTVIQWFRTDKANRVDAIFCFDAVGAKEAGAKDANGNPDPDAESPKNGEKKRFPYGGEWEAWLKARTGRKVAFLNGNYSQRSVIDVVKHLTAKGLADSILMNAPADLAYWHTHPDYKRAHFDKTFQPLQAILDSKTVYLVGETNKYTASYFFTLCHGSKPKTTELVVDDSISIFEAANFIRSAPTEDVYRTKVGKLKNTENVEKHRAGKTRHTWSMSGGERVGGGRLRGYLELALKAAKAKGFFAV